MQRYRVYRRFGEISKFSQIALILILVMSMLPVGLMSLTGSNTSNVDLGMAPTFTTEQSSQRDVELKNQNKLVKNQETLNIGLNNDPASFSSRINQDLWAYYNFDEGSGTSLIDQTGNNPNGNINNGAFFAPGISGSALSFDGIDDYVDLGSYYINDNSQTISIWVKSTQLGKPQAESIFEQVTSVGGHVSFGFAQETSDTWRFRYHNGLGNAFTDTSVSVGLNEWINLVIVKDLGNNNVKYFANGTLINTFAWDGSHFGNVLSNLYLGALNSGSGYYFQGLIDEVRIYTTSLSNSDIYQLYTSSQNNVNPTNQVGWASYLGGSGQEFNYDSANLISGNGTHIVVGATTNSVDYPVTPDAYSQSNSGALEAVLTIFDNIGTMTYSTYLGSPGNDQIHGLIYDSNHNVISGGAAMSGYPTTAGAFQQTYAGGTTDGFVTKLDSNGQVVWSTYFGGTGYDYIQSLTVDQQDNIYIVGTTNSGDFPVVGGPFQSTIAGGYDSFIAKFNPLGSLVYSSYFGGLSQDGGRQILVSETGDVYVVGYTSSSDFPTLNAFDNQHSGGFDMSVLKFDSNFNLQWSSLYGGSGDEMGNADLTKNGDLVFVASTTSSDLNLVSPIQPNLQGIMDNAFGIISNEGYLSYSTYFGGTGAEANGYDKAKIEVGLGGELVIFSDTSSSDFPTTPNAINDTLSNSKDRTISIFDSSGKKLLFSSYLSGNGDDEAVGVLSNSDGLYLFSRTSSTDLITKNGAYDTYNGGTYDFHITKFDGNLVYQPTIWNSGNNSLNEGLAAYYSFDNGMDTIQDYSTINWVQSNPASNPGSYMVENLVYDPNTNAYYFFGGRQAGDIYTSQTWVYNGTNWQLLTPPTSPSARVNSPMVYNSQNNKLYLFGGQTSGGFVSDMWEFDPGNTQWTQLSPIGNPGARANHGLVYDSSRDKILLFGGTFSSSFYNDIWEYDFGTNTWANLNPAGQLPSQRANTGMVYDSVNDLVVLYGGNNPPTYFGDLWIYNYANNLWTQQNNPISPGNRVGSSLTYDPIHHISLSYGGFTTGNIVTGGTWILDHRDFSWTQASVQTPPSSREFTALAFNLTSAEFFGYGGALDNTFATLYSDTWKFKIYNGLKDMSGNQVSGTINGAQYVQGKYGTALSFDGIDDYVDLNFRSIETNSLTTNMWVKARDINTIQRIAGQRTHNNGHTSWNFNIRNGNWDLTVYSGTGNPLQENTVSVSLNTWVMLTIVKDNPNGLFKAYINGQFLTQFAWDRGIFTDGSSFNAMIGTTGVFIYFLNGVVDEFRLYNRTLSNSEIELLYKMNDPKSTHVITDGSGPVNLSWTPVDDNPSKYEIYKNGALIDSGLWNSYQTISRAESELVDGNYYYDAVFYDLDGKSVNSSIELIIKDYYQDFGIDVFQTDWTRTDSSVSVTNGNLSISTDGGYDDYAEYTINANGPFYVETHALLQSGGNNFVTPSFQFRYSNGTVLDFVADSTAPWGWKIGNFWTNDFTLVPSEGQWRWMKIIFTSDTLSLYVKILESDSYTFIGESNWDGNTNFSYLRIVQPWDSIISVDSIRVVETNQIKPIINSPADIIYTEGEVGNSISWTGTDANAHEYILYQNGVVSDTGSWITGVPMIFNVDGLSQGTYNFTLELTDLGGNTITDQVNVFVNVSNIAPTIGTQPTSFSYAEGIPGNSLSWTANDTNPAGYNILMNGTSVDSGSWTSFVPIVLDVDGLTKAFYNFTIEFADTGSLKTTHTVFVTVLDASNPVIVSPSSISYEIGSTGSSLTWTITDNYPETYDVLRNGTSIDSGLWSSGQDITVNVDGLAINTYNFTIIVFDLSGNFATNTVYVTVTSPIAPIVSPPADFSYSEGSAGNTISWDASDDNPTTYTVTRDAVPIDTGSWSSGAPAVTINIDGLVVGVYTFEIELFEINGLSTVDTVVVTVNDNTNPVISSPNDLSFAYGQTGNTISWTATDNYPDTYSITNNSIPLDSGSWSSGVPIVINVDGQPVGDYIYEITVSDANGNSVSDIVVVSVLDVTPPLITSTPGNIDYFEGSTGNTLSWTAIDNHPKDYFVYRNGTGIDSGSWVSGISNYTNIDGLVRGYYNFTIVFTDESGNFDRDTSIVHVIDNTIPDLDSPLDFIFSEGTSAIDWTAGDRHPFTYTVRVDGGAPSAPIAWANGTISYDISSLSLGGHSVEITVYDDSGNFAMDTVIVTAQDQTTPLISSPPDVTYFEGQTGYFVSWTPTDLHPTTYVITVNGSQVVGPTSWVSGNAIILDINGYPLGNSTVEITVSDIGGNSKSDIVYVTVLADDTPPMISAEADVSYEAGFSAPLSWTVNDQYPGNYDVYLDGVLINSSIPWSTGTLSYPGLILDVGTYTFNITIYDQRGNWASDEIQILVSDTTSPIVSGNPTVNTELNVESILIWNVDELYPSNYEIRVDGVLVVSDVFSSTSISYSFNGTSLGDYIVNITVFDESSRYHSYITTVTVIDTKIDQVLSGQDYVIGENENVTLSFIASDALPSSYELYLNGSLIDSGVWGWTIYEELVIGLGFGEYTYEMIVFDTSGNNATITFIVTVGDDIAPIVSSDGDIEVVYQFTSDGLASWTITEDYPDTFELYRNGSLLESGPFQGNSFVFNASSFEIGYWELTLNVYDTFGNSGSASIIVFVRYIESDAPTFISLPQDEIHHIDDGDFVIQWIVYDAYPNNYSLYQDGELITSGMISDDGTVSGDNYIIEFIFSPDVVADYEFILVVTDMWGFSSISDVTTIYVLAPQSELSPEIREVNDLVVAITQEEVVIQWIINEENPSSSQLTVDGIADAVRSWDGSIITLTLDLNELGIGSHTVSITVTNTEGYSSTDLVYILIVEGHDSGTAEGFLPFTSMWIILFAFIAVTIIRRRY